MTTEITNQIQELIAKSREGKIDWQQLNANTIRWSRHADGKVYTVTLQSHPTGVIIAGRQTNQYVFTIQSNTGEVILQLQSNQQTNQNYAPLFQQLLDIATEKTKGLSAVILSKLLDKL